MILKHRREKLIINKCQCATSGFSLRRHSTVEREGKYKPLERKSRRSTRK